MRNDETRNLRLRLQIGTDVIDSRPGSKAARDDLD